MHRVCWNKHILFKHGFTVDKLNELFDLELFCIYYRVVMYDEFKESKVRSHLVIGTLTLKNISF